jgi:hypothetical protein
LDFLKTHTSLSPIRGGFAPGFVNYKKGCTRLATASDKAYQLLAHDQWFSPASSTTKTGRHDIAEILLKVALNTKKSINQSILLSLTVNIPVLPFLVSCIIKHHDIAKVGITHQSINQCIIKDASDIFILFS